MGEVAIKPIVLIIMDGWGMAPPGPGNAIFQAQIPNFKKYYSSYPHALLEASGEAVGLPRGEVGNTEVGHFVIGGGQFIYQDLPRINISIGDGSFFQNPALLAAAEHVRKNGSQLHLMGLVGPGGVHSDLVHLMALIRFCQEQGLSGVALHAFTDGRDSPPTSSQIYLDKVQAELEKHQVGFIASVIGRYYAMDRDFRWDRTEKAYRALTEGAGNKGPDYKTIINKSYQQGKTDEFIEPAVIVDDNGQPKGLIKQGDAVIFFNFRIDRPRQLTKAFVLPDFNQQTVSGGYDPYAVKYYGKHDPDIKPPTKPFDRGPKIEQLFFVTMTEYEKNLPVDAIVMPPQVINMPLGKIYADQGKRQLRAAESEKERFVTYYFNGQNEEAFANEDRLIVPSPKIPTYDLKPEMSAVELTEAVMEKMQQVDYDLVVLNYANPDMVGHTGNIPAAVKGVETVDQCMGKLVEWVLSKGGVCLITGDHGNAEEMINLRSGEPDTEHNDSPVPFIVVAPPGIVQARMDLGEGTLADVAPTILAIAKLPQPRSMTGKNMLR